MSGQSKEKADGFIYFKVCSNHFVPTEKSVTTDNADSRENTANANCVLALPEGYSADGKPAPIIMYCHGHSGYVGEDSWSGNHTDLTDLIGFFTSKGYAVFDVDQVNNSTQPSCDLGCPELMERYLKAYEYIQENYNVQKRCMIYSMSFGTYVAMNMLRSHTALVKTAVCSAPRASIKFVWDFKDSHKLQIAEKFGFEDRSGNTYEADKVIGEDLYASISDGKLPIQIPPIKVFMSSADTRNFAEANALTEAIKNGGNHVNKRIIDGLTHHEMCYLTKGDLKEETSIWFDRFR